MLPDLLARLAAAVRCGDREHALQVAQAILQRVAAAEAEGASAERQIRVLLAELDAVNPADEMVLRELFAERVETPVESSGAIYPVWFATNRKPSADGIGFTNCRDRAVTHGRVLVRVAHTHQFGGADPTDPAAPWKHLQNHEACDDRLHVQRVEARTPEAFFAETHAAADAARAAGRSSQALFFLHGFNMSFEEAAIRAAQIGFALNVAGATAFFSWPSRGSISAYSADEASIEASEQAITDFLVDFATQSGADKVHIIAHSLGNRGLLRALQRIAANPETRGKVRFGQIFLAAPDVDRDLFLDLARLFPEVSDRTTLYASDGDLPMHLSVKLHDAPRAGYFKPYTVAPGVDTVAVPHFDIDLLGQAHFAQAEALLHDIHHLMREDRAPCHRARIVPVEDHGANLWQLQN
jgi:esterase/lipase superfamily enzyme